jgi:glycerate 2-kinase
VSRSLRADAAHILRSALQAVDPARLVARHVRRQGPRVTVGGQAYTAGDGRLAVVAVGKAATRMLGAAAEQLGDAATDLVAVDVAEQPGLASGAVRFVAGHPLPDRRGVVAARHVEGLAASLGADDVLLLLLSGGASALLPAPVRGVSLEDKAAATRALLRAGAPIGDLNVVRRHLSRLKGGGLARLASPARVVTLALSDVVGDDVAAIGSGPTAPDPSRYADALEVLARHGVLREVPATVRHHLASGLRGKVPETGKPGEACFERVTNVVVGSNRTAVRAAARAARRRGYATTVRRQPLLGEAREVANSLFPTGLLARGGTCLVAGGETTVTVRGAGRGGRNQELAVAAAERLAGARQPCLLATLATDGTDGHSTAAGGVADHTSLARAAALGLAPPSEFLSQNDSEGFLAALGDLLITGPTGTNVADLCVLLVGQPG